MEQNTITGDGSTAWETPGAPAYFTHTGRTQEGTADGATTIDHVVAHGITASPWGEGFQHGSPPAALVAFYLEQAAREMGLDPVRGRFARMSVDLLGAVPLGALTARTEVIRPGKRITLLEAIISGEDGREYVRGRGWWLAQADTTGIERAVAQRVPGPEAGTRADDWLSRWSSGYIDSIEVIRTPLDAAECGVGLEGGNQHIYWSRSPYPTMEGHDDTPWTQLMKTVDIANGLNPHLLDTREWTYMNVDMTVYLHRLPVGEWLGIVADANYGPDGIGTTVGRLFDTSGAIGTVNQAIMLAPRQ